jgi:hypothetical protein
MKRSLYPNNWPELAQACKERASWRCEECGVAHGTELISRRTRNLYRMALHAAHLDHDPRIHAHGGSAMCPRCHGRYDFRCSERRRPLALEMLKHHLLLGRQQGGGRGMIDVRRAYRSRFPLPIVQTSLQWAAMCPLKSVHQHVSQKG